MRKNRHPVAGVNSQLTQQAGEIAHAVDPVEAAAVRMSCGAGQKKSMHQHCEEPRMIQSVHGKCAEIVDALIRGAFGSAWNRAGRNRGYQDFHMTGRDCGSVRTGAIGACAAIGVTTIGGCGRKRSELFATRRMSVRSQW